MFVFQVWSKPSCCSAEKCGPVKTTLHYSCFERCMQVSVTVFCFSINHSTWWLIKPNHYPHISPDAWRSKWTGSWSHHLVLKRESLTGCAPSSRNWGRTSAVSLLSNDKGVWLTYGGKWEKAQEGPLDLKTYFRAIMFCLLTIPFSCDIRFRKLVYELLWLFS